MKTIEQLSDYERRKTGLTRIKEIFKKATLVIVYCITKPNRIFFLMNTNFKGYFVETGFFNSYKKKKPVDHNNQPVPWVSYPFIFFIKDRISKRFTIFEYGSGNSSFFYARYAGKVYSVEHDKKWFDYINKIAPENVEISYYDLESDDDYVTSVRQSGKKFDIIIIDGRKRVKCLKEAIHHIKNDGVIVLDDSFREGYATGLQFMKDAGFKKLDFWGPAPLSFRNKSTTIFYKTQNCLLI